MSQNNFVVLHLLSIVVITKLQQRMEDMDREKRKEEVIAMLKKAIEHKKEWQKRFEDTYASPGMKVEFF